MMNKLKMWYRRHDDAIVFTAVTAGMCALYGACVYVAIQQQNAINQEAADRKQELYNAVRNGDMILPNPDGSYWILPRN